MSLAPLVDPGYYWAEAFQWKQVTPYCWERSDGKFHFSDECSQFYPTPYDSLEACLEALDKYVEFLNQPPKEKQQ